MHQGSVDLSLIKMMILVSFIQEIGCVVYTFEEESVECVLYKDAADGAIQSDSAFTLGFCPKPYSEFSITYNNEKISISIPNNIESKFWCHESSFARGEKLCNFPFYGSLNGKTGAFFEPIVGKDGNNYCIIENKEYIAKQCSNQGNRKHLKRM